jgi:hypothetical protein
MTPLRFAAGALACAFAYAVPAAAQQHAHPPQHAQLHSDFYRRLQRPDVPATAAPWQRSCCSDRDCAPTPARFRDGRWEFLKRGAWSPVPADKIVEDRTPDMQAHACVSVVTDELLCFVKPDLGI